MLETFERAALEAGKAIMKVYREGCPTARKADNSPVTIADERAERIIIAPVSYTHLTLPTNREV